MKRKLIMMGLVSSSIIANAQVWTPVAGTTLATGSNVRAGGTNAANMTLHVGDATSSLHFGNQGLKIKFNSGDRALLELEDPSGANRTVFQALSSGTYLDASVAKPLFLQTSGGNVGINNTSPLLKLDVTTASTNDGIRVKQTGTTAASLNLEAATGRRWAFFSTGTGNTAEGAGNFGLYDYSGGGYRLFVNGSSGNVGIGTITPAAKLNVKETNSGSNAAGYFQMNTNGFNRGVQIEAFNGTYNWAGVFSAGGYYGATQNIGIYASTPLNYPANDWAAYLEGHAKVTQNLTVDGNCVFNGTGYLANGPWVYSDQRLKKDIKDMSNSLPILMSLRPKTYSFDKSKAHGLNLSETKQYGFIAQELQQIIPEMVKEMIQPALIDPKTKKETEGYELLTVNYEILIPILVKGIQEQEYKIEQQEKEATLQKENIITMQQQIDELKALVQSLAGSSNKTTAVSTTVSDKNTVVLNQNVPNPFAESTTISYSIPDNFSKAQIIISTIDGKLVKAVNIQEKGSGSLNVFANDLSQGIYTYSLVVDGKMIDTKKMVKQ